MRKCGCNSHRAGTRTSAAVWGRKCLVQVQVHDVEAHIARTHLPQKGVHVGPVIIKQASASVDKVGDFTHMGLKKTESVGIGHHYPCDTVIEQAFKRPDIDGPVFKGPDLHYGEAADGCTCRVGPVCTVRDDDFRPAAVSSQTVVLPHYHQTGKLPVCPCKLVQRKIRHAGKGGKRLGQVIVQFQCSLYCPFGLERMKGGESRH